MGLIGLFSDLRVWKWQSTGEDEARCSVTLKCDNAAVISQIESFSDRSMTIENEVAIVGQDIQ